MGNLKGSKLREMRSRIMELVGGQNAGMSADNLVTALQRQGYSESDSSDAVLLVLDDGAIELGNGLRLVVARAGVREPEAA